MKHKSLILIVPCMTLALISNKATASIIGDIGTDPQKPEQMEGTCEEISCPSDTSAFEVLSQEVYACNTGSSKKCYKNGNKYYIYSPCISCKSPYTKTQVTFPQCGSSIYFTACKCMCTDCNSESWANYGTGYQRNISRTCDCSSGSARCQTSYSYRCAAGYYGTSSNGTSGCTQCPTASGVYTDSARKTLARGTSTNGATDITDCYITSGTYYDATGTFKWTSKCSYKE